MDHSIDQSRTSCPKTCPSLSPGRGNSSNGLVTHTVCSHVLHSAMAQAESLEMERTNVAASGLLSTAASRQSGCHLVWLQCHLAIFFIHAGLACLASSLFLWFPSCWHRRRDESTVLKSRPHFLSSGSSSRSTAMESFTAW